MESTNILKPYVPLKENNIDLIDSLEFSKDYFGDDETFGKIDPKAVSYTHLTLPTKA